jgi:hypothetical protein
MIDEKLEADDENRMHKMWKGIAKLSNMMT